MESKRFQNMSAKDQIKLLRDRQDKFEKETREKHCEVLEKLNTKGEASAQASEPIHWQDGDKAKLDPFHGLNAQERDKALLERVAELDGKVDAAMAACEEEFGAINERIDGLAEHQCGQATINLGYTRNFQELWAKVLPTHTVTCDNEYVRDGAPDAEERKKAWGAATKAPPILDKNGREIKAGQKCHVWCGGGVAYDVTVHSVEPGEFVECRVIQNDKVIPVKRQWLEVIDPEPSDDSPCDSCTHQKCRECRPGSGLLGYEPKHQPIGKDRNGTDIYAGDTVTWKDMDALKRDVMFTACVHPGDGGRTEGVVEIGYDTEIGRPVNINLPLTALWETGPNNPNREGES